MGENEDGEIIEHHVNEEMEKRHLTRRAGSFSEGAKRHSSTQSSHRLLAYSDALISIIATVMILPVAHTKIQENEELKESLQQLLTTKIAVYLMTFLIVTVAWAAHIRLFQVIERIDDCLALLNLACMMLITFLPYTFSLMAAFPENILGILFFCGCVVVIGLIQAVIVLYGFSQPFLLNDQIQVSENLAFYKKHILKVILRVPVFCFVAIIFSLIFPPMAYVILAFVIFFPYISQSLKWCHSKAVGRQVETPESMLFYSYHPNEPLSKERVEAFSDGVYAIVATLLILDICEDNVPDPAEVQHKFNSSLVVALQEFGPEFLAYFGSFATVGLLWFVHHSLFMHVTKSTRLMGILNTFSLAFVGGLPLAYQLTHEFTRNSHNELEAIQISCVIIFFAGIFQLAIWVVALFSQRETLHPCVHYGGQDHAFMLAKLALYPAVALGTFFITCVLSEFSAPVFHLTQIVVPVAFLLLRLLVRVALAVLHWLFCPHRPTMLDLQGEEDSRLDFNDVVT
uniref:Endosomal/lysosomal proton channel TMEM175 n=1 Tax=Paramormyrops kingsleyae TaxID=1676925 RepID=A0A3B3T593_9TELE|nr:endosomal/lysosomal potassium channel TMEM175-like [Paramormyrops kingsleyae]